MGEQPQLWKCQFRPRRLSHLINKCGYFDYQRERVYVRTSKMLRKIQGRRVKKRHQGSSGPSKRITITEFQNAQHAEVTRVNDSRVKGRGQLPVPEGQEGV